MRNRTEIIAELKAYAEKLAYNEKIMAEHGTVIMKPEERGDAIVLICDTIALLNCERSAQEPIKPKRHAGMRYCGNCNTKLTMPHYDAALYCWKCGRMVDWND